MTADFVDKDVKNTLNILKKIILSLQSDHQVKIPH